MTRLRSRGRALPGARVLALVLAVGASAGTRLASAQDEDADRMGNVSYELRQQVAGVLMPVHDYGVTGLCAMGTGFAPASDFAQGGSARGWGLGVGIGGRIGYQRPVVPPRGAGPTWWGFRAGGGLDLDFLYGRVPTGIPDMSGKLCADIERQGAAVQYQGSSVLFAQMPAFFGAELGVGADADEGSWRGIVLGAAWAPALTFVQPWVTGGNFNASYLGTELTLDFVTLRRGVRRQDPGKRFALFLLLPPQERGPVVVTASFGAVWY
jgi:hypothetical protein